MPPQALLWPLHFTWSPSEKKSATISFIFLSTKKKEIITVAKKTRMMEYNILLLMIGCCSKFDVVILAGLTTGVACSERYWYPVQ